MVELEQVWSEMLGAAAAKAGAEGRREVAEYLHLKATNDALREAGVNWLLDTFIELTFQASPRSGAISVEREEPHTFDRGHSVMVGKLVELKRGIRRVRLAAGWARSPSHGIMQKGSLAFARFTHFGMPDSDAEIRLVHGDELPQWLDESDAAIDSTALRHHIAILTAD